MPDDLSGRAANPAGPVPGRIDPVRQAMAKSLFAETMVCTLGAQLAALPATRNLPGMAEALGENRATGHHRLTVQGCVERMAAQDWHEAVLNTCVRSQYLARHHDRLKRGHMMEAKRAAPPMAKPALENWIQWLDNAEGYLQEAMVHTQALLGSRRWTEITSDPM